MKSKTTAYLLWFFLGAFGAHFFYLDEPSKAFFRMFTGNFFGILWIVDGINLGGLVEKYNLPFKAASNGSKNTNTNANNIVVNVPSAAPATANYGHINPPRPAYGAPQGGYYPPQGGYYPPQGGYYPPQGGYNAP